MKKLAISLVAMLIFGLMGFGFAMWADSVSIAASATTGDVSIRMEGPPENKDPYYPDPETAPGDWTCDPMLVNPVECVEGKDVGWTEVQLLDTDDADDDYDKCEVTVHNAYPCYYNAVGWVLRSTGSVPVILQKAKLEWMGEETEISQGKVYALCSNGDVIELNFSEVDSYDDYPSNAVLEICWMDGTKRQLHEGESIEESFGFHVLQPAQQNLTVADGNAYTFGLSVMGIQWNESPLKPGIRDDD